MCTMTWFRQPGGYQVFFNRDELRSRRPAVPPAILRRSGRRFIAPLDGDFGGSWLAVNDCGLTLSLHNGFESGDDPSDQARAGWTSRGLLLTSLIDAPAGAEVWDRLRREELDRYRSFLLTVFEPDGAAFMARWSRGALARQPETARRRPLVSSSFDTAEVRARRVELYQRLRHEAGCDPEERHWAFHRSHRPARGAYSPCMHRPDARTVSFSRVRVGLEQVEFHYAPHPPCQGRPHGEPVRLNRTAG
jgi:hypothetical protein